MSKNGKALGETNRANPLWHEACNILGSESLAAIGGRNMATETPTETLDQEANTHLEYEPRDEIERLLMQITSMWEEEDFMDLPPKNLPTEP